MSYIRQFQLIFGETFEKKNEILPLSLGQYNLWLEQQLYPNDISNQFHFVAKIHKKIDPIKLQNSIFYLAEHYENIRTIFPLFKGIPIRKLLPSSKVKLKEENICALSENAIINLITKNYEHAFDLLNEVSFKFYLYQNNDKSYFQVIAHHIAISFDSFISFLSELFKSYSKYEIKKINNKKNLSDFSEYVFFQYKYLFSSKIEDDKKYWEDYLFDINPKYVLPTANIHQNIKNTAIKKTSNYCINENLTLALKKTALAHKTSFFSLTTSAFQVLLYRYTSNQEMILGIPVDEKKNFENVDCLKNVSGYTTNILPLKCSINMTHKFSELLSTINKDIKNASLHRLYPTSLILENLYKSDNSTISQLFNIIVVSQKAQEHKKLISFCLGKKGYILNIEEMKFESLGIGLFPTGRFDLALAIVETENGYVASFHYNSSIFQDGIIDSIAHNYLKLLQSIANNPDELISNLDYISDKEKYLQINAWNSTALDIEQEDFVDYFEKQVHSTPNAPAVIFEDSTIDYQTLNRSANQLARYLKKQGIPPDTLIGVCLNRSPDLIISLIGIMKAGCSYLPIDPDLPRERIKFMLEDSQAELLITEKSLQNAFQGYKGSVLTLNWNQLDKENENTPARVPNHLAYVIYTSGSTGMPKGVEIFKKSLNNLLVSMQRQLNLSSYDKWLALTTISFDISNLEILLPLRQGSTVVLASHEIAQDPHLLAETLQKYDINFAQATPSTWQMLLDYGWNGNKNLTILCGGEALPQTLAERLVTLSHTLWNMYGPTETTIWSSMKKIENSKITIGKPIANTTFYILDENKKIVPIGVPGELYIGGIGLAKGYRNRPQLTEERFVATPFSTSLSDKVYRTGDLVRYLPDGDIEYLGRIDHQVKVRGHRIELGEIEETIKKFPGIHQVTVIVREDTPGDKRIVAYLRGKFDEKALTQLLSLHLPSYMIPSAYVKLTQFPLTANGKVDRKALPVPHYTSEESHYASPKTPTEKAIAEVFEELLESKNVSIHSHFFSLGGHSLLAARVVTKINLIFHINLPLKTLLEKPTIAMIAKEVDCAISQTKMHQSVIETQFHRDGDRLGSSIPKAPHTHAYPLSSAQLRFWFLDQQEGKSALYTIPHLLELRGNLNVSFLENALQMVMKRHKILRTIFREGVHGIEQIILPEVKLSIRYEDLSCHEDPEKEAFSLISCEAKRAFELNQEPLFHYMLLKTFEQKHFLFLNFHHIIFDGHSINVLLREVKALYEAFQMGHPCHLEDLQIQYVDYAYWQQSPERQLIEENHASWWLEKLSGAPHLVELPFDKPRLPLNSFKGATVEFSLIDAKEVSSFKHLAQKHESTLFMFLLSVFHVFLYRYTGQNDIVIGVPISDRSQSILNPLIGCFVNTLPLRTTSNSENTFLDLLKWVQNASLEAFEHQDISFEKIIEKLKIERSLSHSSLFQVMFNMIPALEINCIDSLHINLKNLDRGMSHFDLSLSIQETAEGIVGIFEYNTDLFFEETVKRMSKHFRQLVYASLEHPECTIGKLPMLEDSELHKQIVEWNRQPIDYPKDTTILQLFEKWAERTPHATAIVYAGRFYSYEEINAQANKIAHTLMNEGLQPEGKVLIYLERSAEFISTALGILKAGGAYIPVDPAEPKERALSIQDDLSPFCIITHSKLSIYFSSCRCLFVDKLPISNEKNPSFAFSEDRLAYIIYTSGSTGKPKGVQIEYRSINDRVLWKNGAYPLSTQDVLLHTYSFIFDGAIINYFWPLCAGACLVIATKEEQFDSSTLVQIIQKYRVTTMDLLPTLLQGLLDERDFSSCRSLKNVFSGGEALPSTVVRTFYENCNAKLHNTYGPTETTVEASVWECDRHDISPISPIGKAIAGAKLYILDSNQNITPVGVPGELHIGGVGVSRGYINDPLLTAEKFIPNFFNSSEGCLYCTGDLVKYREDGNIEFLGRIDNQVKIRGYRIDLREIESTLLHMDPVDKAIVRLKGNGIHKSLVAYIVLSLPMDEEAFSKLMAHYLKERLPAYMIPQQIVLLPAFPLLPNGKTNFKALPEPIYQKTISLQKKPKNQLEEKLLTLWKEILDLQELSITDNFFEVGGNSLLAMRLITKVKNKMDIPIPLISLFQYPTIEALSEFISTRTHSHPWSPIIAMQPKGQKAPFFFVHPVGGGVLCYSALAKHWPKDRPFYAFQARGLEEGQFPHESIEIMAKEYVKAMLKIQPLGPYLVGGWSYGGLIAAEIVRQLTHQGEKVSLLVLIDSTANIEKFKKLDIEDESLLLSELTHHLVPNANTKKSRLSFKEQFIRFIENGGKKGLKKGQKSNADRLINLTKANYRALQAFSIPTLDVKTALVRTETNPEKVNDLGWSKYVSELKVLEGPGDHWAITSDSHAHHYVQIIQECFDFFLSKENSFKASRRQKSPQRVQESGGAAHK